MRNYNQSKQFYLYNNVLMKIKYVCKLNTEMFQNKSIDKS